MKSYTLPLQSISSGHQLRGDVQGMRGIAVLLVVLHHKSVPFMPGGFVVVEVFLVILVYLIADLLVRERYDPDQVGRTPGVVPGRTQPHQQLVAQQTLATEGLHLDDVAPDASISE